MEIRQSEEYVTDNWWKWSVWLDAPPAELDNVESVEWRLHPTFPDPIRRVSDRATNFRLDTAGWGVFPIHASVKLKGGTTLKLRHQLQWHFPDGGTNTA
jgi:transcription initiation factor IIF auxiliary subunit